MDPTVERFIADFLTAELTAPCDLTRHVLHLLAAVAPYRHADVARWTSTWMTGDLTVFMFAVLVLRPLTVLTTGVWQEHWVIIRLFEPSAVAAILGHLVFSIAELAIWTCPIEES